MFIRQNASILIKLIQDKSQSKTSKKWKIQEDITYRHFVCNELKNLEIHKDQEFSLILMILRKFIKRKNNNNKIMKNRVNLLVLKKILKMKQNSLSEQ